MLVPLLRFQDPGAAALAQSVQSPPTPRWHWHAAADVEASGELVNNVRRTQVRLLTIVDEYTRECLAIDVARRLNSENVLERLAELFVNRGVPDHIRSDNGPEFTSRVVRGWLERVGVKTLFIEPGSPWENGYVESFNGKLRDELLNGEIFYTLKEAQSLVQAWRRKYNQVRPHSSLGYRPPAPKATLLKPATLRSAGCNNLLPAPIL